LIERCVHKITSIRHVTRINLKKTGINIAVPHHNGRIAVPKTFGELTNVQAAHSGGDGDFEPGDGVAGGIGVSSTMRP